MLDDALRVRVVWINGAAGSCKTSLVSSWMEARGREAAWFHVDEADADPATFFHYLGVLAQQVNPRWRGPESRLACFDTVRNLSPPRAIP